jgi:cytochrome c
MRPVIVAPLVLLLVVACGALYFYDTQQAELEKRVHVMTGGDPKRGQLLVDRKGCDGCHDIPGARGPHGTVGPPLSAFARRMYISGLLTNTPENLRRWLLNPRAIEPRTVMPPVGLSDQEARDLSAYLYTLE